MVLIMVSDFNQITGRQIAAARVLLGMGQAELAALANISTPTLRRMEASVGAIAAIQNNLRAVCSALEGAGISFMNEEGRAVGVKLRLSDKA